MISCFLDGFANTPSPLRHRARFAAIASFSMLGFQLLCAYVHKGLQRPSLLQRVTVARQTNFGRPKTHEFVGISGISQRIWGLCTRRIHFWSFQPSRTNRSLQDDAGDVDFVLLLLEGVRISNLCNFVHWEDAKLPLGANFQSNRSSNSDGRARDIQTYIYIYIKPSRQGGA